MELYIEKEFLDKFFINYDKDSVGHRTLATIFETYHELEVFIDAPIEDPKVLSELEENEFFSKLAVVKFPESIKTIKDHFFAYSKKELTIILTDKSEIWFPKAENLGALCLCSDNFVDRIETILRDCHLKIDLSHPFAGWNEISCTTILPLSFITINDNYIMSDRAKMDKNLIQLLKGFLKNKQEPVAVKVFTKKFDSDESDHQEEKKANAILGHGRLHSGLANYQKDITTINNDHGSDFDFHDRIMFTNFLMIDSGKGFNLLPFSKPSNSQLIIETIFSKYTYKRIKNHQKMQLKYLKYLKSLPPEKFKSIPEI